MAGLIPKRTEYALRKVQHDLFNANVPVLILFEGCGGRVMGRIVNEVMNLLEPRGVSYHHFRPKKGGYNDPNEIMSYLENSPANGRICLYDRGWYSSLVEAHRGKSDDDDGDNYRERFREMLEIERYFADNGTLLVKVFIDMDEDSMEAFSEKHPAFTGNCSDLIDEELDFDKFRTDRGVMAEMIEASNRAYAPWDIIALSDLQTNVLEIVDILRERMNRRLRHPYIPVTEELIERYQNPRDDVDLSLKCDDGYWKALEEKSAELLKLQCKLSKTKRSLILVFEGWDAAGKGGSIRRVTRALNPRGFDVVPIKSPTEEELAHSHLWRFCRPLPKAGHVTIFDRSWYGRMMVEPIEGFCTDVEYSRSAREINLFERALYQSGAIIIKFWMEVSKEEQLKRFNDRLEDPMKSWKITDEDWRNRDRWDNYENYIDRMLRCTNTPFAPWHAISSEDKRNGRLQVLDTIIDALKSEL